jgi:hypothetical protein
MNLKDRINMFRPEEDGEGWGDTIPVDGRVKPNYYPVRVSFSMSYASIESHPHDDDSNPREFSKDHVGYWINYMAENVIPSDEGFVDFCNWLAKDYVGPDVKIALVGDDGEYATFSNPQPEDVYAAIEIVDDKSATIHGWFTTRMWIKAKGAGFAGAHSWFPVDEVEKGDRYK